MIRSIIIFLLCISIPSMHAHAELRGLPSLTVLAASSLTNVLTDIARAYSVKKGITITSVFDASSELADTIEHGSPADIYISAHPKWMQQLKQKGQIDVYSLANLTKNKLALAVPKGSKLVGFLDPSLPPYELFEQVFSRSLLVIADPDTVPLGIYTKQFFSNVKEQYWDKASGLMIRAGSARQALYLVAKGNAAGVVYFTDAWQNDEVELIAVMDDRLYEPIIYQVAVVAGEHMSYARDFVSYLKTTEARLIFAKYGFVIH